MRRVTLFTLKVNGIALHYLTKDFGHRFEKRNHFQKKVN